ncbi:sensor histidine kinase [Leucobacter sp. HY1910]
MVSHSLLWLALTGAVLALYAAALWGAARLLGSSGLGGIVAVGVVAIAIHPAATWLRRRIERWVYGYRAAPGEALRLLGERVDQAAGADVTELVMVTVAEALNAERVWLEPSGSRAANADVTGLSAVQAHPSVTIQAPLVHSGRPLGTVVARAREGKRFAAADAQLLSDLAHYAAALIAAEQLAVDVGASREAIVRAREEERRRLRRDLHDGVGPALAAVLLQLAAASRGAPPGSDSLIREARKEVREAIREVRRLVNDLRPAALDELGLVGAVRARVAGMTAGLGVDVEAGAGTGAGTGADTDADAGVAQLPAAVEVAAYRIALESVTNVVRHAAASHCRVSFHIAFDVALGRVLVVEIADNGRGLQLTQSLARTDSLAGVGWRSLQERAAELGGSCERYERPTGGLVVTAKLPLHATVTEEKS